MKTAILLFLLLGWANGDALAGTLSSRENPQSLPARQQFNRHASLTIGCKVGVSSDHGGKLRRQRGVARVWFSGFKERKFLVPVSIRRKMK